MERTVVTRTRQSHITKPYTVPARNNQNIATTVAKKAITRPRTRISWSAKVARSHYANKNICGVSLRTNFRNLRDPRNILKFSQSIGFVGRELPQIGRLIQRVDKIQHPLSMAIDGLRIGRAIYEDVRRHDGKPKETVITAASIASGWGGTIVGGIAGSQVGSVFGASVGGLLGGIGAIPGTAIGSIIGGLIGCISVGFGASIVAESIAEKAFSSPEDDDTPEKSDEPECEDQEDYVLVN